MWSKSSYLQLDVLAVLYFVVWRQPGTAQTMRYSDPLRAALAAAAAAMLRAVCVPSVHGFSPTGAPSRQGRTTAPKACPADDTTGARRVARLSGRPSSAHPAEAIHLRIVHFNDVYKLDHLPKLKGLVDHLKREQAHGGTLPSSARRTICTLGGDFFSPSLLSTIDKGASMTACLTPIVDYACLGNHEADVGLVAFGTNVDLFGGTIINSNFPIVPPSRRFLPTHVDLELANNHSHVRTVRLLGLLENDPNLYLPGSFGVGAVEASEDVLECCRRHIESIHQFNHFGIDSSMMILPLTHQALCNDVELAKSLGCPSRMPLILGGHDHEPHYVAIDRADNAAEVTDSSSLSSNKCRVLKAGIDAETAIVIDVVWPSAAADAPEIDVEFVSLVAGLGTSHASTNRRANDEQSTFPSCPDLEEQVRRYMEPLLRLDRTVLKTLERRNVPLTSVGVRQRQTSLGSLICTALRKATRADAAILNGGCVRGNTVYTMPEAGQNSGGDSKPDGCDRDSADVGWKAHKFFTYGDLIRELPYETEICLIDIPGSVLEQAIHQSRNAERNGCRPGAYLQVCNKLELESIRRTPGKGDAANRDSSADFAECDSESMFEWRIVSIGGQPFDPDRIYKVACQHHLLTGMDNIRPLEDYFCENGPLPPLDAARPAKELVLRVYHKEIWLSLPPFESIDTDRSDSISRQELSVALASVLEIEPSDELIDDTLDAMDGNEDGSISRGEYEACLAAIRKNRFDWDAHDCMEELRLPGQSPDDGRTTTTTTGAATR